MTKIFQITIKRSLTFLLLLFSLFGFSQYDSLILTTNPKSELNIIFGFGKQSQIKYQVENGQNIFLPSRNHAWEANINYAISLGQRLKFSIGTTVGAGSLEMPFEITNEQFPGIHQYFGKDYESGYFGISDQSYSDLYYAIPIKFYYNIFQFKNKHNLWLNAGIDFQYLHPNYYSSSYSLSIDSVDYELLSFKYYTNPNHAFNLRFNLGMEYRFQLPYYHELILGINYAFHTKDVYKGTYEILQFNPNYAGNGTFSNHMNLLSLNIGYSFNKKRKRFNQYQNHKKHKTDDLILPPDTMPNLFEIRFGTNPSLFAWNTFETPNTAARFEPNGGKFQILAISMHYLKYKTDSWAWYTGLDADFGAYDFDVYFDKKDYPYLLNNFNLNHQEIITYLNIPFGYQYNYRIGKKSNIEISAAMVLSINIASTRSISYYLNTIDSFIIMFNVDVDQINYLTPGGQFNVGYSYETKRKNKWILGLRGTMNFIKSYTMEYQLLNPDKTYYHGEIDIQPINVQLYWRYALTGKRKRYLKQIGY